MSELPNAIPLLSPDYEQVGFVLLAVEPDGADSHVGECVFMLAPENGDVIESDLGVVVSELKVAGEHSCRVSIVGERLEIVVTPTNLPQVRLIHDPQGDSAILTVWDGSERQIGIVGLE